METLQDNLTHWSRMTTIIDQRLLELDESSEMYAELVRAREQYCLLISHAR